jgi:hypothetical protein
MSVWMDYPYMLGGDPELAEEVVWLLGQVPVGLSCDELARRTGRRRADVLDMLRWDPRCEHEGQGRGSRWRLAALKPPGAVRDGLGRTDRGDPNSSRTSAVEDVRTAEAIPGQTTVYDGLGESPAE